MSVGWSTDDSLVDAFTSKEASEAAAKLGVLLGRDGRSIGFESRGAVLRGVAREKHGRNYLCHVGDHQAEEPLRAWRPNNVLGVAIDMGARTAHFGIDGTWSKTVPLGEEGGPWFPAASGIVCRGVLDFKLAADSNLPPFPLLQQANLS